MLFLTSNNTVTCTGLLWKEEQDGKALLAGPCLVSCFWLQEDLEFEQQVNQLNQLRAPALHAEPLTCRTPRTQGTGSLQARVQRHEEVL